MPMQVKHFKKLWKFRLENKTFVFFMHKKNTFLFIIFASLNLHVQGSVKGGIEFFYDFMIP